MRTHDLPTTLILIIAISYRLANCPPNSGLVLARVMDALQNAHWPNSLRIIGRIWSLVIYDRFGSPSAACSPWLVQYYFSIKS